MAAAAVIAVMSANCGTSIHPFFNRAQSEGSFGQDRSASNHACATATGTTEDRSEKVTSTTCDEPDSTTIDNNVSNVDVKTKKSATKRRSYNPRTQRTLNEILNPQPLPDASNADAQGTDISAKSSSRKRRKTGGQDFVDVEHQNLESGDARIDQAQLEQTGSHVVQTIVAALPLSHSAECDQPAKQVVEASTVHTPPRKVLQLKANGKFGSPVLKKAKDEQQPDLSERATRRASKRSTSRRVASSLVVKLSYRSRASREVELKIARILSGDEHVEIPTLQSKESPKKRKPKTSTKETHPFFVGKKEPPKLESQPSPRKLLSATTPGKLRMQAMLDKPQPPERESSYVVGSDLFRDRFMIKHPGARDPPFPDKQQAHVRGFEPDILQTQNNGGDIQFHARKKKQAKLPFPANESVLIRYQSQLTPEEDRPVRPDGFREASRHLKIPRRLLISGQEISRKTITKISGSKSSDIDELAISPSQQPLHPALANMYARIPSTLTAFDELTGESLAWTQKYAPATCTDVLQSNKELVILRGWLQSLVVQTVSNGPVADKTANQNTEKAKKRRKNKSSDLDGFLVDSDEEICEMNEVDDVDGVHGTSAPRSRESRKEKKSLVQSEGSAKMSNAILLSGPSGCGKTAAAYAVAKELGFKVFEISPGERRSGKDVLDKIGNMTENHLMKHHGSALPVELFVDGTVSAAEEPDRLDEDFQRDLENGRQGKMKAFFKPQANSKVGILPYAKNKGSKMKSSNAAKAAVESLKKPSKEQQQSLILLEEVDILFKEDKEFWATVLRLMSNSKRPFIMTCNDEALVPLKAVNLHAVLRLKAPHIDLATDYMLLLAGAEGHLLERDAVASLYRRRDFDLRASITELDYWCQMGVGDPREGLGWIYQRWPPGSDLNERGQKLRIVSEGTYHEAMSFFPTAHQDVRNEDALAWVWKEFGVEPATAIERTEMHNTLSSPTAARSGTNRSLKQWSRTLDALSSGAVCCSSEFEEFSLQDLSQRPISQKQRNQYITNMELLQTDESPTFSNTSRDIAVYMAQSAYKSGMTDLIPVTGNAILRETLSHQSSSDQDIWLNRKDFACFDTISAAPDSTEMTQSAFDSTLRSIALDLAPYVRSIVRYDQALAEQRERLSLLTSDGRRTKRARTTRAARSALEGGQRATTRRENYFDKALDLTAVLETGCKDWPGLNLMTAEQHSLDDFTDEAALSVASQDFTG